MMVLTDSSAIGESPLPLFYNKSIQSLIALKGAAEVHSTSLKYCNSYDAMRFEPDAYMKNHQLLVTDSSEGDLVAHLCGQN